MAHLILTIRKGSFPVMSATVLPATAPPDASGSVKAVDVARAFAVEDQTARNWMNSPGFPPWSWTEILRWISARSTSAKKIKFEVTPQLEDALVIEEAIGRGITYLPGPGQADDILRKLNLDPDDAESVADRVVRSGGNWDPDAADLPLIDFEDVDLDADSIRDSLERIKRLEMLTYNSAVMTAGSAGFNQAVTAYEKTVSSRVRLERSYAKIMAENEAMISLNQAIQIAQGAIKPIADQVRSLAKAYAHRVNPANVSLATEVLEEAAKGLLRAAEAGMKKLDDAAEGGEDAPATDTPVYAVAERDEAD